jgi:uncharacterized YigZ family protein
MPDTYKTILHPSAEVLFKDKNSKFYGYAFPITAEDQVKEHINALKKAHRSARHWCYAYQIGTEKVKFRVNDDGEPSNSAGNPIYGQIQSFGVTNVLIVIVRYFGGVKLGVGGLINAYRTAAKMAMEGAEIVECTVDKAFKLTFGYKDLSMVMRIIRINKFRLLDQNLDTDCELEISVRKNRAHLVSEKFDPYFEITVEELLG